MAFSGKCVVVTGAASGIGFAIVQRFISLGANVVVTDIDADTALSASVAVGNRENVLDHRLDVRSELEWAIVMEAAAKRFGGVDVLVNNAGAVTMSSPETMTLEDWRNQIAINLDSVFIGTKAAIARMKDRGGSIVNVASVAAKVGIHTAPAYCAAKSGVVGFTRSAALYCAHKTYGIRINCVLPGYADTPLVHGLIASSRDEAKTRRAFQELQPIGRLAKASEIASAVTFLASDEASFITGTELAVDGGYLAR